MIRRKYMWIQWVVTVGTLIFGIFYISGNILYLRAQVELVSRIQHMVTAPVVEVAFYNGSSTDDTNLCFLSRSNEEISEVTGYLKNARKQMLPVTLRMEPFVLRLNFNDGSQAFFSLYKRSDLPEFGYLENLRYEQTAGQMPRTTDDIGVEFHGIGTWATVVVDREKCK